MKTKFAITAVIALTAFCASEARADESRVIWQCGNVRVTYSSKDLFDSEYTVTGIEKPNNHFKWTEGDLYLNSKLCWPVKPLTCLKTDGRTESCESRQIPFPRPRPAEAPEPTPIQKTVLYNEPGGVLGDHIKRWQALAASGNDVEIRGHCA